MKPINVFFCLLLFFAAACNASKSGNGQSNAAPEMANKTEAFSIVGKWESTSGQTIGNIEFKENGEVVLESQPTGAGHMHAKDAEDFHITYTFDDKREPAWLDLVFPKEIITKGGEFSIKGIVEFIDKDNIKMQAGDIRNPERPADFTPEDKTIYLRRIK